MPTTNHSLAEQYTPQHTAGNWTSDGHYVSADINGKTWVIGQAYAIAIGTTRKYPPHLPYPANARLMASAPELLDALRAFCGDYESTPITSHASLKAAYLHALEVIAKAEGRA